ncbi:hypothetical protein FO519_006865 [Halicephalobus sp. NKZ332]|nr:hypothetical protein FO519_006865 [Halicephalobus sp. NKZ332]
MTDDYEVKRNIWDGKVPIEFVLDPSEMRANQSFFFFQHNVDELEDVNVKDVWLAFNGKMLKWNYPIGVLYDIHITDNSLPWVVTLRFKNFPDELVRCGTHDLMRHYFLQTVKEADQMKHKGAIMSTMKVEEHGQLFQSITNDKFDDFWVVNRKLMEVSDSKSAHIPIRFYLQDQPFRQVLITSESEGEANLLSSALKKACPELEISELIVVSQGISVPLDSPVLWLSRNFAYPDNFVHLVIRNKSDSDF